MNGSREEDEPLKPTFDIRKQFEFVVKHRRDYSGVQVLKQPKVSSLQESAITRTLSLSSEEAEYQNIVCPPQLRKHQQQLQ